MVLYRVCFVSMFVVAVIGCGDDATPPVSAGGSGGGAGVGQAGGAAGGSVAAGAGGSSTGAAGSSTDSGSCAIPADAASCTVGGSCSTYLPPYTADIVKIACGTQGTFSATPCPSGLYAAYCVNDNTHTAQYFPKDFTSEQLAGIQKQCVTQGSWCPL